jgi:hypothetical protein
MYKEKLKKTLKESHNSEKTIEKHRAAAEKNWQDAEYRRNMITTMNTEDVKSKKNASMTKSLSDPKILQKYSDSKKILWTDDSYREKQISAIKERWASPKYKEQQSQMIKERWSNAEYADKCIKSLYKYKEFTLPSGTIVKLQGYEPQVLNELLTKYEETDIFIGVKNIHEILGKITYIENDKEHSYYPDFYVKSIHTIFEVKSEWTYEKWKERNELKKQACKSKGFNFKFIILKNANSICII